MYEFNQKQKKMLKNFGMTHEGKEFGAILADMKLNVTDASNIDPNIPAADVGIHVEARKVVKTFITELQNAMTQKKTYGSSEELDDFE